MSLRSRAIFFLAFLGAGYALAASRLPLHLPPVCMFKLVTGLPCPGCGMTHAFCAMAHGEFHAALNFNLAAIPLAILTAIGALLLALEAIDNKPRFGPAWKKAERAIILSTGPILMISWSINLLRVLHH